MPLTPDYLAELQYPGRPIQVKDMFNVAMNDVTVFSLIEMWKHGQLEWHQMLLSGTVIQSARLASSQALLTDAVMRALPGEAASGAAHVVSVIERLVNAVKRNSLGEHHSRLCEEANHLIAVIREGSKVVKVS